MPAEQTVNHRPEAIAQSANLIRIFAAQASDPLVNCVAETWQSPVEMIALGNIHYACFGGSIVRREHSAYSTSEAGDVDGVRQTMYALRRATIPEQTRYGRYTNGHELFVYDNRREGISEYLGDALEADLERYPTKGNEVTIGQNILRSMIGKMSRRQQRDLFFSVAKQVLSPHQEVGVMDTIAQITDRERTRQEDLHHLLVALLQGEFHFSDLATTSDILKKRDVQMRLHTNGKPSIELVHRGISTHYDLLHIKNIVDESNRPTLDILPVMRLIQGDGLIVVSRDSMQVPIASEIISGSLKNIYPKEDLNLLNIDGVLNSA